MDFPPFDPLASLHGSVADWAGSLLLASVADDSCPRCSELERHSYWNSPVQHLHTDAEKGAALLAAYQGVNHPEFRTSAERARAYDRFDRAQAQPDAVSLATATSTRYWRHAIGGPDDPLGPAGPRLGGVGVADLAYLAAQGVLVAPVASWQAAEDARRAATAARRTAKGAQDRAYRQAAAEAATAARLLEPEVQAWHAEASGAWQAWQSDLAIANAFVPISIPTQEKAGLSWH